MANFWPWQGWILRVTICWTSANQKIPYTLTINESEHDIRQAHGLAQLV